MKTLLQAFFTVALSFVAVFITSAFVQPLHLAHMEPMFWKVPLYLSGVAGAIFLVLKNTLVHHFDAVKSVGRKLMADEEGQDIAEYAVMLAVILIIVVGTIRLIGSNANRVFSDVGSAVGQ